MQCSCSEKLTMPLFHVIKFKMPILKHFEMYDLIKLTYYDETKKKSHDSQMVRAKADLFHYFNLWCWWFLIKWRDNRRLTVSEEMYAYISSRSECSILDRNSSAIWMPTSSPVAHGTSTLFEKNWHWLVTIQVYHHPCSCRPLVSQSRSICEYQDISISPVLSSISLKHYLIHCPNVFFSLCQQGPRL